MIDRQLITYAFLAQTNPTQGDLLSGLAPIVKPIARELAGQTFDAKEFSRRVEELYQISIHPWVADDLAPRLEKAGLLVKTQMTARLSFSKGLAHRPGWSVYHGAPGLLSLTYRVIRRYRRWLTEPADAPHP